jgi:hypothetical protein
MKDLSTLTAETDVEFALFTKGSRRLVIRGDRRHVEIDEAEAKSLAEQGYRWSGHTHPGIGELVRTPSKGDYLVLAEFNQKKSVIYDALGKFDTFNNLIRKG